MLSLEGLAEQGLPGMLALYDLAEICKDSSYKPIRENYKKLQDLSLLQADGKPHDSIRNIVISAVQGEGLEMRLGSPVADDSHQKRAASSKESGPRSFP